jgi:hypothetical protein
MERGSSKHGPRLDEEMEQEDQTITRSGQPPHTEEWRETEPFEEGHLDLALPEDEAPAAPPGMTTEDVERRSDIARYLAPHKLPASRGTLLDLLQRTGAPDDVIDAIGQLPADHEFRTVGEIVRALGIRTEEG